MKPRAAIISLTLALLAAPLPSEGQQRGNVYRIGWLAVGPGPTERTSHNCPVRGDSYWQALVGALRGRGYVEGQNLVIDCRWTEGRDERAPTLAAELVSLKVDLLIAYGATQVLAAKQSTTTIPVVMVGVTNPVGRGLVASLAHPGGNVTGPTDDAGPQIAGKYLQLLKDAVPKVSRVAVLEYSGGPPEASFQREAQTAAQALAVTLQSYGVRDPKEFAGTFTAMTKARVGALLVLPHPFIYLHGQRIVDLAAQSRLPAMYPYRDAVESGGLMGYEAIQPDIYERLGSYVEKIFHGAKPGDLPVEQPTKFELLINLTTAKALGLTIPPSLLSRADEVIQ
jgi:putative ABC transport system substrate-binding protein